CRQACCRILLFTLPVASRTAVACCHLLPFAAWCHLPCLLPPAAICRCRQDCCRICWPTPLPAQACMLACMLAYAVRTVPPCQPTCAGLWARMLAHAARTVPPCLPASAGL